MTATPLRSQITRIVEHGPNDAWLIVITKGGREKAVRDRLEAQGFDVYLPMRPLDAATQRRRGVSAAPFFPRILFARATLDADRWQAIFSTIGVQRVMCDPFKPRGLRADFVLKIRDAERCGFVRIGLRDPSRPAPPPPPRDPRKWVKMSDAVEGLINETLDDRRGSVLVSLLSGSAIAQDIRRF